MGRDWFWHFYFWVEAEIDFTFGGRIIDGWRILLHQLGIVDVISEHCNHARDVLGEKTRLLNHMFKQGIFGSMSACLGAMLMLVGCASDRSVPLVQVGTNAPSASAQKTSEATQETPNTTGMLVKGSAQPFTPFPGQGWKPLFDGKTLIGWQPILYGGHGDVELQAGLIVLNMGDQLTGIRWTNEFPKVNYEVALEAMKVDGSDFFCGLTFPVADSHATLILGGWGGALVGLSSIDGLDASENETTQFEKFERGQWYRVRVRVTSDKIQAWLDDKRIIDLSTEDKKITLRYGDIERSKPLGISTWQTVGAMRQIQLRSLSQSEAAK